MTEPFAMDSFSVTEVFDGLMAFVRDNYDKGDRTSKNTFSMLGTLHRYNAAIEQHEAHCDVCTFISTIDRGILNSVIVLVNSQIRAVIYHVKGSSAYVDSDQSNESLYKCLVGYISLTTDNLLKRLMSDYCDYVKQSLNTCKCNRPRVAEH